LVLRQLAVIKVNVKKLDDRVKNLSFSNSVILTSSVEDSNLNNVMGEFPMNTEEALMKVELLLIDKTYKLNLVRMKIKFIMYWYMEKKLNENYFLR
jgi:hypothetical protein